MRIRAVSMRLEELVSAWSMGCGKEVTGVFKRWLRLGAVMGV